MSSEGGVKFNRISSNQFESIFNPCFLNQIRETLSEDLSAKLNLLEQELITHGQNNEKRLEIRIRQLSVASILVESYIQNPTVLVIALKNLAEEYRKQDYFPQNYKHSMTALNKYKIYEHEIKNVRLQNELYLNLCESCFDNKSYREGLFYIQEYNKKKGAEKESSIDKFKIEIFIKLMFVQAKTLYKIGEFKESEEILEKVLEELEQKSTDIKNDLEKDDRFFELMSDIFIFQTEALNHLGKIAKKEGRYVQMADFVKQILKCCDVNEKYFFDKSIVFRTKTKFFISRLAYLDLSNQKFYPTAKNTVRKFSMSSEFLECFSNFLKYLKKSLKAEIDLVDSIKNDSIFAKLMTVLKSQSVHFFNEVNFPETYETISVLTQILEHIDAEANFENCAHFLLNEMLKIQMEKSWKEEFKNQVKAALRKTQKISRIIKNSFLKNVSKSLYVELDSLKEGVKDEKIMNRILEICAKNVELIFDKIVNKTE